MRRDAVAVVLARVAVVSCAAVLAGPTASAAAIPRASSEPVERCITTLLSITL
jgi:hypothetical protein